MLRPDINNTTWVQASLANVLHDNNLRYGNDKSKEENTLLSNREKYNVYSPKFKKWYWINMEPADGKNMVAPILFILERVMRLNNEYACINCNH